MLTLTQTEMLRLLVHKEIERDGPNTRMWSIIQDELDQEIRRHCRAIELSKKRNASKHGRRGQRGPTV